MNVVDRYWQRHFTELSGRRYDSPQVAGPYTGTSGPSCGGEPSVPGNAYYCPAGRLPGLGRGPDARPATTGSVTPGST